MERRRENLLIEHLDSFAKKYSELKMDLITTERHLLKEMGFICQFHLLGSNIKREATYFIPSLLLQEVIWAKRVAASCVWPASKLEESPRKVRHVLNMFHIMERRKENLHLEHLDSFAKKYSELKMDLITTERDIS
ncbi:hypothetical protein LguiA_002564 [Lonicera macranthoides]